MPQIRVGNHYSTAVVQTYEIRLSPALRFSSKIASSICLPSASCGGSDHASSVKYAQDGHRRRPSHHFLMKISSLCAGTRTCAARTMQRPTPPKSDQSIGRHQMGGSADADELRRLRPKDPVGQFSGASYSKEDAPRYRTFLILFRDGPGLSPSGDSLNCHSLGNRRFGVFPFSPIYKRPEKRPCLLGKIIFLGNVQFVINSSHKNVVTRC